MRSFAAYARVDSGIPIGKCSVFGLSEALVDLVFWRWLKREPMPLYPSIAQADASGWLSILSSHPSRCNGLQQLAWSTIRRRRHRPTNPSLLDVQIASVVSSLMP